MGYPFDANYIFTGYVYITIGIDLDELFDVYVQNNRELGRQIIITVENPKILSKEIKIVPESINEFFSTSLEDKEIEDVYNKVENFAVSEVDNLNMIESEKSNIQQAFEFLYRPIIKNSPIDYDIIVNFKKI